MFSLLLNVETGPMAGISVAFGMLRLHFWLPELLWMIGLFFAAQFRYGDRAKLLRSLPPYADELIFLPLPFIDRLIVDAYREDPAAARAALDYLLTSTYQQRAAFQAMAGIAVESLARCHTVEAIVAVADELAWIPLPPPKEVGPFLPQFVEVAQSVRAAQEATSPYRRRELLGIPLAALQRLRDSLGLAREQRAAMQFGGAVDRWIGTLEAARRALEEQARRSGELPQGYVAGVALDPEGAGERFKGRQDLFREIESLALAAQPPVLLLHGVRRSGKTSVLRYLPRCVGAELIPLLIDIQGVAAATTLSGIAENLARQIVEAGRRSRNVQLKPLEPRALEKDPFPALQRWMEEAERRLPGKRFLLCLDEFERLDEVIETTGSRAPLNFLRNVMQHRSRWIVLFSGAHRLEELPGYWNDYLINVRALKLSYLSPEETRELILHPIPDFPEIYPPGAVERIAALTRGQPYLTQLLCYQLVERLNRERRRRVEVPDVEAVIPEAFAVGAVYFREWWGSLGADERAFLLQLAQGTGTPDSGAVERRLIRKDILEKGEPGVRFQVPLLQRYVETTVEEEG